MIGILGAMGLEVETLKAQIDSPTTSVLAGMEYVSGLLAGKETVVACCGVGKVNAAMYTQLMLERYPVEAVLQTGIAGAVAPELSYLAAVVADRLTAHDLRDDIKESCWPNLLWLTPDPHLRDVLLRAAGDDGILGTIVTGDRFICSKEEKADLHIRYNAVCAEMESAAIAQVCMVNKIPFAVVRCISDLADGAAAEDYLRFERLAAHKAADIVLRALAEL